MKMRDDYPAGAPCWVDTLQPDPRAALQFYGPLLGWSFDEAASMTHGLGGDYLAARVAGRLVAGIGQAPASSAAVWSTYVRVDDIEQALAQADEAGGARLAGALDAGSDGRVAVLTDATGVALCLWQAARRIGAELIDFAVRDADAIAEHAAALGGTVMMAPIDTPGFRSAVIADPQGGVIAVSAPAR